jgi:hypothetical protein
LPLGDSTYALETSDENFVTTYRRFDPAAPASLGAALIVKALDGMAAGALTPQPQPSAGVTYASKVTRDDERLDWRRPAAELVVGADLVVALDPAGGLWIAWPKRSSGVATDLDENRVREIGLAAGLVDNKVCAIDATWSGLASSGTPGTSCASPWACRSRARRTAPSSSVSRRSWSVWQPRSWGTNA